MEDKRKINTEKIVFATISFATVMAILFLMNVLFQPENVPPKITPKVAEVKKNDKNSAIENRPTLTKNREEVRVFKFLDQAFTAFIYNSKKHKISFFYQSPEGENYSTFENVNKALVDQNNQLKFAMNAGIFKTNNEPEGLFINKGKEIVGLNEADGSGNFYLKPNGVFYIMEDGQMGVLGTEEYAEAEIKPYFATQSGPALLLKNTLHPAFNQGSPNLRVRNGVGIISPYEAVFLISEKPVNFYDFAKTFQEKFNCSDALYLDGVISDIYLPEVGRNGGEENFSGIIAILEE